MNNLITQFNKDENDNNNNNKKQNPDQHCNLWRKVKEKKEIVQEKFLT